MISEIKSMPPYIDFGFGITERTAGIGEKVTIWLSSLYNQEIYNFYLISDGSVTKISDYEYEVVYYITGNHEIKVVITPKAKGRSLISNILNLTVAK